MRTPRSLAAAVAVAVAVALVAVVAFGLPSSPAHAAPASAGADELPAPGYLRFPDIHGANVVFAAEHDLWVAPVAGGNARRLTHHEGEEKYPHFSPDGTAVAFTASYDGNDDVYVVPVAGGEPRRLTWHPARDEVVGWTPDGEILFSSNRFEPHRRRELFHVQPTGGEPARLPLGWAARLDIDRGTGLYAFNRISRETRTWKRYRGGTAQQIWVGHPDRGDYARITDFDGTDSFPMWAGGLVWFLSDEGGTMNLWSMAPDGQDRTRHTDFGDWDARWPAIDNEGRIVFMLGGDIHLFDTGTKTSSKLDIRLPSDRLSTRQRFPDPSQYLTWASISPEGDRVLYVTRGEVFSVPVEDGVTLPVTAGSGARESWANFSHDGERIVYVTDASGEEAIVTADAWGRGDLRTVKPAGERGWHAAPVWSPDGARIAWSDDSTTLWHAPAGGGAATKVDVGTQEEIRDYTWSVDGRWLAYTKTDRTNMRTVWVHDTEDGTSQAVTGPNTNDHSPSWDPEGKYLWFVGERFMNPVLGNRDFSYAQPKTAQIYVLPLRSDVPDPFLDTAGAPPAAGSGNAKSAKSGKRGSKGKSSKKGKSGKKGGDDDENAPPPAVTVEFDGIFERAILAKVDPGSYSHLEAAKGKLFFVSHPVLGMAEQGNWLADAEPKNDLMVFDLEEEEASTHVSGVLDFELAAKGGKLLVLKSKSALHVVGADAPPDADALSKGQLDLGGVVVQLDPKAEWRQMFIEAWRNMRDFHWDQGMRGLDWPEIRAQYEALLPRLATRGDLKDLIGEMIGELATSHTYVWGGDQDRTGKRVGIGLLGADLTREGDSFRVDRIYRGDPADGVRSPLSRPGVDVKEGDWILSVNNRRVDADEPFLAALQGYAGKAVLLTVNSSNSTRGARNVVVTPMQSELELRYADWVRGNREHVASKTDGKIAYIHIPDMSTRGLVEFEKWFYPQLDAEGMVVDARWNGGGFVSQLIIERLRRPITSFDRSRGGGVFTYPWAALNGPFVVLTNEHAGSDGDIFPATIQAEGLAPVIGMRSWGGVVGIRADKRLVDGGILTQPEYAYWGLGTEEGWTVENHGVDPDIVVQNLPQDLARGVDAQLDRGIEEVLKLREATPPLKPAFGETPDKSRNGFQEREGGGK